MFVLALDITENKGIRSIGVSVSELVFRRVMVISLAM